ncbi:MAG: MaoC family dehydratase [Chloroflexi bacterium]|nr:MaoC family dehydratase [Chloroflexota bacterium]
MTRPGSSPISRSKAGSGRAAAPGWWFEDAVPGAILRHRGGRTVADADHVWLAWLTNNASDVHGNAHTAQVGEFGRPVVLGALTVAIVVGLARPAEGAAARTGRRASRGWSSIRLRGPVFAGDTLYAESAVHAAKAEWEGGGTVGRTIRGFNQRGETVVEIDEEIEAPSLGLGGTKDC